MVMIILGILALISINPSGGLHDYRTNQAAQKIQSDIRYAQSYALATQHWTGIRFTISEERYRIYVEDPAGTWTLIKDPLTKQDFDVDLDARHFLGVNIGNTDFDGRADLAFNPAGKPHDFIWSTKATTALSSTGTVGLDGDIWGCACNPHTVVINVEPVTGEVTISR